MINNYTAIILSGGKSSRMGENKAKLLLNGETLIERTVKLCKSIFTKIIIITNSKNEYGDLDVEYFADIFPNFGPLSGIHSGLANSKTENNFVISCDMPFVKSEIIKFLIDYKSSKEILLPKVKNNIYSLCGIYKKSCINKAEKLLRKATTENSSDNSLRKNKKTKVKLFDLINNLETDIIDVEQQSFYNKDLFFNMNTNEDYEYVKAKLSNDK
ncbi:MAG: molybdenum cofactor guanylyltransferase [Melioribacteraceae bacterium]